MVPLDLGVPASRSSDSVRRDGRAVAGTTEIPSNVGCSLLCFEEAVNLRNLLGRTGVDARGRARTQVRRSLDVTYRRLEPGTVSARSLRTA
jgi:hypothetical protein